ncbi:hypothetical protein BY458DRAFT_17800 [Sporodiniella umbellata]|nr:hypothetical protein BY458DRAFT_17800 [Sporodiniella umbellata]
MTAKVIPNGIMINTPTSKHIFASFLSRDQAYEKIVNIWKIHKRMSSLVLSSSILSSEDISSAENSFDDSKELISLSDHSSLHSHDSAIAPSTPPLLLTDENMLKEDTPPQPLVMPQENKSTATTLLKIKDIPLVFNNRPRSVSDSYAIRARYPPVASSSNQNKTSEKPYTNLTNKIQIGKIVKCPCMKHSEQHSYIALDRIYPGTVETMDKLFYQTRFIKNFLECCENFEDVQLEKWKNNSRDINGKRKIKVSESRKKIITTLFHEKREHCNLPYYSCVASSKSMPDMPMGAIYYIQSRTCITRVSRQRVRVLVTFDVKFKKSGLVSSVIENNAVDDQFRQYSHLASVLDTPRLARELIKDEELLLALRLKPKHYLKTASDWMKFQTHPILQTLTFIALFLVVASQVILAVRVASVNSSFLIIQNELKQQKVYEDTMLTGPSDAQLELNMAYNKLEELKEKVKQYDQHFISLKASTQ